MPTTDPFDGMPVDAPGDRPVRLRKDGQPWGKPGRRKPSLVDEITVPLEERAEKPRKEKAPSHLGVMCDMAFLGAFRIAAEATGHEHWIKSHNQVRVATEPLQAMIERMPKAVVKELEGKGLPIIFLIGLGILVVPDLMQEMRIRRYELAIASGQVQAGQRIHVQPGTWSPVQQAPLVPGPNGAGPAVTADGEPIPTADPRTPGLDIGGGYP